MKSHIVLASCTFLGAGLLAVVFAKGQVGDQPPANVPGPVSPSKFVSPDGSIRLPEDYRSWTHLGTWQVADGKNGELSSHQVYAEPEAVAEFRETGKWSHGATIVKEVRSTRAGKLTTGQGSWDGPIQLWFVMVEDTKRR